MDERTCRGDRAGTTVEAKSFEAARPQLVEQRAASRFAVKRPAVNRCHRQLRRGDHRPAFGDRRSIQIAGHDDFSRLEDGDLVGERLHSVGAGVLGGHKFSGRHVEQRDA